MAPRLWTRIFSAGQYFLDQARGSQTLSLEDVPRLVSDRRLFDRALYTPLSEAWEELQRRRQDPELEAKVNKALGNDVPAPLLESPRAVLFRNLITPNHENRRFVSIVNGFDRLEPLFFEYTKDKFTSNNELKRTLGKLYFTHGRGKKGGVNMDSLNVIDFLASDGKSISTLQTLWGQGFVEFHHEFFDDCYKKMPGSFFDASDWLRSKGGSSLEYYKAFLTLFIRHGILFENMMLDKKERSFAEHVFLPSFLSVCQEIGVKPLIVALEPTEIEGELFWTCYPGVDKAYVEAKLSDTN